MAVRIIVLEREGGASGRIRCAFWADVPVARRPFYADPNKASAWSGATAGQNTELQTGAVVELVDVTALAGNPTLPQIKAALEARWTAWQDEITARNPWDRYGTTWDGTNWTNGGVA